MLDTHIVQSTEKLVGHEKNKDTVNVDTRTVGVKSKDAGKTLTLSL